MKRTRKAAPTTSGAKVEIFNGNIAGLINRMQDYKGKSLENRIVQNLNQNFKGGKNFAFEDYIQALKCGTTDYFEAYEAAKKAMNLQGTAKEQIYSLDVNGLFFDTGIVLSGEPESWLNVAETESSTILDIYYNNSAPYTVNEKQYFSKLLPVMQLVDELEQQGKRCNIYVKFEAEPNKKTVKGITFNCQIKAANEVMNFQHLSTLICSPILLRFCAFLLSSDINGEDFGNMYTDSSKEAKNIKNEESIYIPSFYYDSANKISNYNDLITIYPHLKNQIK